MTTIKFFCVHTSDSIGECGYTIKIGDIESVISLRNFQIDPIKWTFFIEAMENSLSYNLLLTNPDDKAHVVEIKTIDGTTTFGTTIICGDSLCGFKISLPNNQCTEEIKKSMEVLQKLSADIYFFNGKMDYQSKLIKNKIDY